MTEHPISTGDVYRLQPLPTAGENRPQNPDYDMVLVVGISVDAMVRVFPWTDGNKDVIYEPLVISLDRVVLMIEMGLWTLMPDPVNGVQGFLDEWHQVKWRRDNPEPPEYAQDSDEEYPEAFYDD